MPPRLLRCHALAILAVTVASAASAQELLIKAQQAIVATAPGSHEQRMALLDEAELLIRYDMRQSIEKARALRKLASAAQDDIAEALALVVLARTLPKEIGRAAGLEAFQLAVAKMPKDAPPQVQARFAFWKALAWHTLDEPAEFMTELRRAYDLADPEKDAALMVQIDVVAINELRWSEDPVVQTLRICERARQCGSSGAQLAADMLLVLARQATGQVEPARRLLDHCETTAARLGDRCSQVVMAYFRAELTANDDPEAAKALAAQNLALAEQLGDREMIALAHYQIADLAMLRGDADTAMVAVERAVDELTPLDLHARLADLHRAAAEISATRGDVAKARQHGQRLAELRRTLERKANLTDRSRLWAESEQMRREMRSTVNVYESRLEALDRRFDRLLLWGSVGIALLVGSFAGLLLRAKRRLERGNRNLEEELELRGRMQQEREALERNLRQLERLDSIGMLAGGFAHDFNNILVSVLGNAQMLLEDERIEGEGRDMLEQVIASSQRAARLCRDLLQYARDTSSARKLVDMRDLVASLLPLARVGLGGSVEIDVTLCEATCPVEVDTSQIEQVLMNMLVNAGDAMHGAGRIDLDVQHAQLPGRPPTGHWFGEFSGVARECVAVTIRDHGEGMDDATIRRVFDPFFSTRFAGRGLGLASSFSSLRRHGGVVEIISARGEGACFRIYLPRSTRPTPTAADEPTVTLQPAARRAPPAKPQQNLVVLVVDDEPFVRDVARRSLERIDARVHVAAEAQRAMQIAERHSDTLSLAVLDVTMPRVDGPTLAQRLRELRPDLPVLFMTGHAKDARHISVTNSSVVQKPFTPEALQAAVTDMLGGRRSPEVAGN